MFPATIGPRAEVIAGVEDYHVETRSLVIERGTG